MEMNTNIKGNDSDSQSIDEEIRGQLLLLTLASFLQLQNTLQINVKEY